MRRTTRVSMIQYLGLSVIGTFPSSTIFAQTATPPGFPQTSGNAASNVVPATNNSSNAGIPASAQPAPQWNRPIYSFIDPRNGVIYDRFVETENMPTTTVVTEQKTERRWVPVIQTETIQQTITEKVPSISWVLTQTPPSVWRPFNQQPSYQYVQKVEYVEVNRVVNTPVSVQKYVEKEIQVPIPKLVQTTQSRQKIVDRQRAGQNLNGLASNYVTTPIASVPSYAPPVYATNLQPPYTSPTIAPVGQYQAATPAGQYAVNGQTAPLVPIQNVAYATAAPNTAPQSTWPNWFASSGPLFKSSWFRQNQLLPANTYASNPALAAVGSPSTGFGGAVAYAYQPANSTAVDTLAGPIQTNVIPQANVMPPQTMAGKLTIQPTTSSYSSRTAAQVGMPATDLR